MHDARKLLVDEASKEDILWELIKDEISFSPLCRIHHKFPYYVALNIYFLALRLNR